MGLKLRETKTQGTHIHASEAYHALLRRWSKPDKWPNWVKKGGESPGAEGRWEKRETWVYFFKQGSPEETTGLFSCFRLTEVTVLGSGGSLREKAFAFNHDSHTWHQQTLMRSPDNWDGEWQAGGGPGECSRRAFDHPRGNRQGMGSLPLFWSIFSSLSFLGWPTELNSLGSHSHRQQFCSTLIARTQNCDCWNWNFPKSGGGGEGRNSHAPQKIVIFFYDTSLSKEKLPITEFQGEICWWGH